MIFSGFIKADLVNYPSLIAATVFTQGCNFSCPYCHNPSFVTGNAMEIYTEDDIIHYLKKHKNFLDGLVISGGEPALHKDLPIFIQKVKETGLKVKIDTNGSCPDVIKNLLNTSLVDYIAMDVKTVWSKYSLIGCKNIQPVKETMKIIKESDVLHEFRTTTPYCIINREDFLEIAEILGNKEKWFLQIFNNKITLDKHFSKESGYSAKELSDIIFFVKEELKENCPDIVIR